MADIARLWNREERPDRAAAISALRQAGNETIEGLWRHLVEAAATEPVFENRVAAVEKTSGLPSGELLEVLACDAARQAVERGQPGSGNRFATWLSHHSLELLCYAVLLAVALTFVLRVWENQNVSIVVPRHDTPAYRLLSAADLKEENRKIPSSQLPSFVTSKAQAAGRYTLRSLVAASPLKLEDLSQQPLATLKGRRAVSLTAELGGLEPIPGTEVSLVFASRGGEDASPATEEVRDALLLAIETGTDPSPLVVAMTESDFGRVKPLLGSARVLVAQSVD